MPVDEVEITGMAEFQAYLARLAPALRERVEGAIAEYLIGNDSHGLRHEADYKYVSRAAAYGQTFVSDRQRRYVMARIREGSITPGVENRTHQMVAGWDYEQASGQTYLRNEVPGVEYVQGDNQARQPAMVGWRRVSDVISTNIAGALRHASAAIAQMLRGR